jgi:dTDP-4-amino-4,6-dideoxygalactose transaminase
MIPVNRPVLDGNERKYLAECIETGWVSSEGPFVKKLEGGVAKLMGCAHGVAVCNGSVAIEVALAALRIGGGDEVILPSFTIISCAAAIARAGAIPVVVDYRATRARRPLDVGARVRQCTSRSGICASRPHGNRGRSQRRDDRTSQRSD